MKRKAATGIPIAARRSNLSPRRATRMMRVNRSSLVRTTDVFTLRLVMSRLNSGFIS